MSACSTASRARVLDRRRTDLDADDALHRGREREADRARPAAHVEQHRRGAHLAQVAEELAQQDLEPFVFVPDPHRAQSIPVDRLVGAFAWLRWNDNGIVHL